MKENLEVGIITTDKNLVITYWSPWIEKITNISQENALGKVLTDIFPEIKERKINSFLEEVLKLGLVRVLSTKIHGYLFSVKPQFPSKYFDKMQQWVSISPIKKENEILGLLITIKDVTPILEEELKLREDLKSSDENVRIQAIKKLSHKEDLVEAISDESWKVRKFAIEEIKKSSREMVEELLRRMKEEYQNINVLNSIIQILSSMDLDIINPLSHMLSQKDPDLRLYTVQILQNQKDKRIEDLLIKALDDENPNVVFSAIEGLGKIKSQKAIPKLLSFIEKRDFYLSIPSLEALKEIKDPTVLPHIYPLLQEELFSPYIVEILGEIGNEDSFRILVDYLNKNTKNVENILIALGKIYKRYEEIFNGGEYIGNLFKNEISPFGLRNIIDHINNLKEENLKYIIPLLGYVQNPVLEKTIVKFIGNPNIRSEVINVLVKYGKDIVPLLIEKLKDEDIEVRVSSIIALGRIGDSSAVPYLIEALKEEELVVLSAGALAKIGDRRAFEPLINMLRHPNPYIRQAVISALNSIGHPEMPKRIKELLKSGNPYEKESAIKIAGYFGYEECKEDIFNLIKDENEEIRRVAYENIIFFDDERIPEILNRGLDIEKRKVREVISKSLVFLDQDIALPLIEKSLKDSSPWVRYYGVKSLVFHNPPNTFDILSSLLEKEDTNLVKAIIIESLGKLGNKKSISILKSFLNSDDKDLVINAIKSLGNIDHPETIPLLLSLLSSEKDIKREALKALGNKKDDSIIQNILWTIATEDDKEIIKDGLLALLNIDTRESFKAILSLSIDSSKEDLCIEVLSQISKEKIPMLLEEACYMHKSAKKSLILALEKKKFEVSSFIGKFLKDRDRDVRIQAILSLENLGSYDAEILLREHIKEEEDSEIIKMIRDILERKKA